MKRLIKKKLFQLKMKVIERSVQEIGQSLLVSLPKAWTKQLHLRKGSTVKMIISEQGNLSFAPEFSQSEERKEANIVFDQHLGRRFFREYFLGNERITVQGKISDKQKQEFHHFLNNFMNVQVIEESKDKIVVKCFKINELTVDECLNRMFYLSLNLMQEGYKKEITVTAKKFYYMLVMQIRRFLTEGKFTKENEMPLIRALDYRMAAEKVDRIIRLTETSTVPKDIYEYYAKSFSYFRNNDYEKALHLWNEEKQLQERYSRLKGPKREAFLNIISLAREISMLIR